MGRREASAEELSAAVGAIYDAAMDEALWPCALKRMADLLGGNCAVVAPGDGSGRFPAYHSVGYSPELVAAYADYYRWRDPMLDVASRSPPLGVLTDRMVMPKAELRRLEVHSDFARPNGIDSVAYAFAFRASGRACFVAATRSARGRLRAGTRPDPEPPAAPPRACDARARAPGGCPRARGGLGRGA